MGEIGKSLRLKRIFKDDGKTLIVALDHGLGTHPVPGLEKPFEMIRKVVIGGADAVLISMGTIRQFHRDLPRDVGIIASIPPDPRFVRMATILGAHAVKNTFFGPLEDKDLQLLYPLALECQEWGMPFLAEIVPMDAERKKLLYEPDNIKVAARMGSEFGADFVKTSYTGSSKTFMEVTEVCPVPVVILGGAKMDSDQAMLENVRGAIDAGGGGVAFGRNIFQHRDPTGITRAISMVIHEDTSVKEALEDL